MGGRRRVKKKRYSNQRQHVNVLVHRKERTFHAYFDGNAALNPLQGQDPKFPEKAEEKKVSSHRNKVFHVLEQM